jgi:hypothetical protein
MMNAVLAEEREDDHRMEAFNMGMEGFKNENRDIISN